MLRVSGKRFGFTLVEVLVICSMLAVMVVGIIFAINRAFMFIDNTRVKLMATNLAREGVEMVYSLRDSNRRKYSGEKDKHRLRIDDNNPSISFSSSPASGVGKYYYIGEKISLQGDTYIYAGAPVVNDVGDEFYTVDGFFSDTYNSERDLFRIDFTGTYSYYSGGAIATGNMEDLLGGTGIKFYRVLRVYGIYKKNTNKVNEICAGNCLTDGTPAEMRFCVKIFYENQGKHASELCSIMTNFME